MTKKLPHVVLVGRINAGKSTLFNTLTETTKAIVDPTPGTTRDLNYAELTWRDKTFTLVDTGGLDAAQLGSLESHVQKKAYHAIEQSALVLFIVDGRIEPTISDKQIAKKLKKNNNKIILVISKIDGSLIRQSVSSEYYKLGLGEPFLVSAIAGMGTGDLLDEIITKLPKRKSVEEEFDLKMSIIGKTNVGKSSILNTLLGEERVIVTPAPHTTREPQDISIKYHGKKILLVDTAGLRKKRKLSDKIEKESAKKTINTIKRSDVSLLVIDSSEPLSRQDQTIAQLALDNQNSIIIVANKWDLVKDKDQKTLDDFTKKLRKYFSSLEWVPITFVSAKINQRISKLIPLALEIQKERQKKIPDEKLESLLRELRPKKAKPSKGKKSAAIYKLDQTKTAPPSFSLYVNHVERIHSSYLTFLENKIRSRFGFIGTPIIIKFKKKK